MQEGGGVAAGVTASRAAATWLPASARCMHSVIVSALNICLFRDNWCPLQAQKFLNNINNNKK